MLSSSLVKSKCTKSTNADRKLRGFQSQYMILSSKPHKACVDMIYVFFSVFSMMHCNYLGPS